MKTHKIIASSLMLCFALFAFFRADILFSKTESSSYPKIDSSAFTSSGDLTKKFGLDINDATLDSVQLFNQPIAYLNKLKLHLFNFDNNELTLIDNTNSINYLALPAITSNNSSGSPSNETKKYASFANEKSNIIQSTYLDKKSDNEAEPLTILLIATGLFGFFISRKVIYQH